MEIEGRIILDLPMVEGISKAGNPWKKKEWVMEQFTTGNFPRKVMFEAFGNKMDNIHVELGKCYAVSVDLESREFNGRWFTSVSAYAAREIEGPSIGSTSGGNYGNAPATAPFGAAPAAPAAPFGAPAAAPFGAPAAPAAAPADLGQGSDDLPF